MGIEQAATELAGVLALPSSLVTISAWNDDHGPRICVWIARGSEHLRHAVPHEFRGYPVETSERPAFRAQHFA